MTSAASRQSPPSPTSASVRRSGRATATRSNAASNSLNGREPGYMSVTSHRSEPGNSPARTRGINPARTRLDLPHPDGPTTPTSRFRSSLPTSSDASAALPKKSTASVSLKARKPLKGFLTSASASTTTDPTPPNTVESSSTNESTSAYRSITAVAVARATTPSIPTGSPGRRLDTAASGSPTVGDTPVSAAWHRTPSEKTSDAGETSPPVSTSGGR